MKLSHFSDAETIEPYSVEQSARTIKPTGLWVSVDGPYDWPSWCRAEDFDIGPIRHRVELDDGPLILSTAQEVCDFHDEFGEAIGPRTVGLNWERVAGLWPGVIIAPYQWSVRRDGPLWYYAWDCASGCIWDASVITSVERVTEEVTS